VSIATDSKRPQEAIAIARTVQKQRPNDPEGFMLEAMVETTNRNFDAATGLYQKVLKRFPSSIPAVRLHSVLVAAGKQREADQHADSWLKSQPKDVLFRNYLATIFMAKKDYSAALEQYQAVVALQPQDPATLNNMAWNMVQLNKPGAVELAQKANALLPNKPALMDTLASALAADKKLKEAIDLQKRAVTLAPEDQELRLNLARLYVSNGDRSAARSELDRLETTKPSPQVQKDISALRKGL
jgi:Flp pilus assembly protein TadD